MLDIKSYVEDILGNRRKTETLFQTGVVKTLIKVCCSSAGSAWLKCLVFLDVSFHVIYFFHL